MSKPIGVLGGIFDPVHYGHLATAMLAHDYFDLEKVVFVPAGIPPHKVSTVTASAADRLEMLTIALENDTSSIIWDQEARSSAVSYTFDTIEALAAFFNNAPLYFIVGSDNLGEIPTWHRYRDILKRVTLCVTERPGYPMSIPAALTSATVRTFPSPCWGVSSTLLRDYFSRGYRCRHLLPEGVRDYIMKRELYRNYEPRKGLSLCKQKR